MTHCYYRGDEYIMCITLCRWNFEEVLILKSPTCFNFHNHIFEPPLYLTILFRTPLPSLWLLPPYPHKQGLAIFAHIRFPKHILPSCSNISFLLLNRGLHVPTLLYSIGSPYPIQLIANASKCATSKPFLMFYLLSIIKFMPGFDCIPAFETTHCTMVKL